MLTIQLSPMVSVIERPTFSPQLIYGPELFFWLVPVAHILPPWLSVRGMHSETQDFPVLHGGPRPV